MPKMIAFLRAINVGGRNVTMPALATLFEELGLEAVETFIASGNVIFDADGRGETELQTAIANHLEASLGYEVATFLRTDAEVAAIADEQPPFPTEALESASALNVAFLASPPGSDEVAALEALATDIDAFAVRGREAYWLCRRRQSESTISGAILERALRQRSTLRSFNTVARLAAKYPAVRA